MTQKAKSPNKIIISLLALVVLLAGYLSVFSLRVTFENGQLQITTRPRLTVCNQSKPLSYPLQAKAVFIPLDEQSIAPARTLTPNLNQLYNTSIYITDCFSLPNSSFIPSRFQIEGDKAVNFILQEINNQKLNTNTTIIAITSTDLYLEAEPSNFYFSIRSQYGKIAIVSTARMNLSNNNQPTNNALFLKRLEKMIKKNLSLLYLNLGKTQNPKSVRYGFIGSLNALDMLGEEL